MKSVTSKDARMHFASLINAVQHGRPVVITRRGKQVARLLPPMPAKSRRLPNLSEFRKQIKIRGKSLGKTVVAQRQLERY